MFIYFIYVRLRFVSRILHIKLKLKPKLKLGHNVFAGTVCLCDPHAQMTQCRHSSQCLLLLSFSRIFKFKICWAKWSSMLLFSLMIALQAYNITVVKYRPILSAECRLPFWPQLTHPAARSLCDSWATCLRLLIAIKLGVVHWQCWSVPPAEIMATPLAPKMQTPESPLHPCYIITKTGINLLLHRRRRFILVLGLTLRERCGEGQPLAQPLPTD